ncbi:MAG: glycoside hydrolase family 3 C-terminal domain-containing protein [Muribaculaceae bacterium]|nr:glycoside hydrolase family 3 C-terminal domain-containing protein [Muribaculaceae bacterium]
MRLLSTLILACAVALPAVSEEALPYLDESLPVELRIDDALSRMTLDEKIAMVHAQSKFSTPGCPRLGIPEIWMSDGPHGVRMEFTWDDWQHAGWSNDSCTAMPALTCLAATFNPSLAADYGMTVGREARFRKKDVMLGPGVNIYRTPLSGRNFEYMGEDPCLAAAMVVPYIKALQSNGVAACIKHFALNNQEHNRDNVNVDVDERALNEIYLPAFKAGVDAGVWAVMGSYNRYKGTFCTHNDTLVNKILKGEWGFDGVMITDWGSAHDTREAALNGLDMEMGSWTNGLTWGVSSAYDNYFMAQPLKKMILAGELPESVLDDKVRRILRLNMRTNMNRRRPYGAMHTEAHLDAARRVAEEGIVLLKNEKSFLPIAPGSCRIAVIGENAVKKLSIGGGSSELKPRVEVSALDGIRAVYGDDVEFALGYASGEPDYSRELPSAYDADSLREAAVELAARADVVLFFGGLNKNYTQDCEGDDRRFYHLPFGQDELVKAIAKANPRTAVIITSGNAVEMPWLASVPAVMQSWYLGSMGGHALAAVISGKVNPSGKLPFSIGASLADYPAHNGGERTYPGIDGTVHYDEGIMLGYRWHDTMRRPALFAFGHGLSYTSFDYGRVVADKKVYDSADTIRVQVEVANKGALDGAETVQFYVSQKHPALPRPAKELKGFCKKSVDKGTKAVFEAQIPVAKLAYYDDRRRAWRLDDDEYTIHAAAASDDVRSSVNIKVKQSLLTANE